MLLHERHETWPRGLAANRGRVVYKLTVRAAEGAPLLPAESVATATSECEPFFRLGVVNVHLPSVETTVVPNSLLPSKIEIVAPLVPVPETVGVVPLLVRVILETVGAVLPITRLKVLDRSV